MCSGKATLMYVSSPNPKYARLQSSPLLVLNEIAYDHCGPIPPKAKFTCSNLANRFPGVIEMPHCFLMVIQPVIGIQISISST